MAYLTLQVEDWNMFCGVMEMFDESIYPSTKLTYKLPTVNYHPSDFFQFFEEMQEQEE